MTESILNLGALRNSSVELTPFSYLCIDNFINPSHQQEVADSFPRVLLNGSVPLQQLEYRGAFATLMTEMQNDELRHLIAEKFEMNLTNRPCFVTVRANARRKDGRIHADTKSKLITVLLYLNSSWESQNGRLRLLYNNHDLNHYAKEITPTLGRCLIFKVTPNCWHGHPSYVGPRRAIQLNYLVDETALQRHLAKHTQSAKWKRWWHRLMA